MRAILRDEYSYKPSNPDTSVSYDVNVGVERVRSPLYPGEKFILCQGIRYLIPYIQYNDKSNHLRCTTRAIVRAQLSQYLRELHVDNIFQNHNAGFLWDQASRCIPKPPHYTNTYSNVLLFMLFVYGNISQFIFQYFPLKRIVSMHNDNIIDPWRPNYLGHPTWSMSHIRLFLCHLQMASPGPVYAARM